MGCILGHQNIYFFSPVKKEIKVPHCIEIDDIIHEKSTIDLIIINELEQKITSAMQQGIPAQTILEIIKHNIGKIHDDEGPRLLFQTDFTNL